MSDPIQASSSERPEGNFAVPTFADLSDTQFEELVLEWIRLSNPRGSAHRLGKGPLSQEGHDIRASLDDGTAVYCECKQCKRPLGVKKLEGAVARFLEGAEARWAKEFWLITSGKYTRTEDEARRDAKLKCRERGIRFKCLYRDQLWDEIKNYPELVKKYLGRAYWELSLDWCQAKLLETREEERRSQPPKDISMGSMEGYDDGFIHLSFLMPTMWQSGISALVVFKTDGLEHAMITLGNDDVLDALDETTWEDGKPLLAVEHNGRAWAQIGNVRLELEESMFAKLADTLRRVRNRWLKETEVLDSRIEANGFQFIDKGTVKLGRIDVGLWREMLRFADEHQSGEGNSEWHVFASSPVYLIVDTEVRTSEMEPGEHLILGTSPIVRETTSNSDSVDLIWIAPFALSQGKTALGRRGIWGCDTAVRWLEDCFLPHLLELQTPRKSTPSWIERFLPHSPAPCRFPKLADFFYSTKATNWASKPVEDLESLRSLVAVLQRHFLRRMESRYPGNYAESVDRALLLILTFATEPELNYLRVKADLDSAVTKSDLLRLLEERLRKGYAVVTAHLLEYRLRALDSVVRNHGKLGMNSAEFKNVSDILRPLAEAYDLYNRLLAYRVKPSTTFPV